MKSYIFFAAALGTLAQATWPLTSGASKPTTQNYFDYKPPLETVTIPNFPLAQTSSSSHDPDGAHSLSSLPTGPSVSTSPPSALTSLSSLPTANATPSQDTVQHALSSAPIMHISSSPVSTVAYSQAYNSFSQGTSVVTPLSGASSARISSSHVDDNLKTHTVTENDTRTVTTTVTTTVTAAVTNTVTAAVIDPEAPCRKPLPAVWGPPRRPTRPHPITPFDASIEPGATSCGPPHKAHGPIHPCLSPKSRDSLCESHGSVRPYPPDDNKHQAGPKQSEPFRKHHGTIGRHPTDATKKYPHEITVLSEATCPLDFTCQPDEDYTENSLAIRDNEQYPKRSSRVCPERYSCQMRKKLPPAPPRPSPPVLMPPPYFTPSLTDPPPHPASPSTSVRPSAAPSPSAATPGPTASSHPSASKTTWTPGTIATAEAVLSVAATVMYMMLAPLVGLAMA